MVDLDPEDWANLEPEALANSEPDIEPHSKLEAAIVGEPISVCSSSDWDRVNTLGFTFKKFP